MEFRDIYRGVTISVRYDPVTSTFIGNLSGFAHPVSIQAGTYDDFQDSFIKAIDDALLGKSAFTDHSDELPERPENAEKTIEEAIPAHSRLRLVEKTVSADDDPFSRRKFLR